MPLSVGVFWRLHTPARLPLPQPRHRSPATPSSYASPDSTPRLAVRPEGPPFLHRVVALPLNTRTWHAPYCAALRLTTPPVKTPGTPPPRPETPPAVQRRSCAP